MNNDGQIVAFLLGVGLAIVALIRWALVSSKEERASSPIPREDISPQGNNRPREFIRNGDGLSTESIRRRDLKSLTRWEFIVRGYSKPCMADGVMRCTHYSALEENDTLKLVREPQNPYGSSAILIYADCGKLEGIDLGYVPAEISPELAALIDEGKEVEAHVRFVELTGRYNGFNTLYAEVVRRKPVAERAPRKTTKAKVKNEERQIGEFTPTSPDQMISLNCPACGGLISHPALWFVQRTEVVCDNCQGVINVKVNREQSSI